MKNIDVNLHIRNLSMFAALFVVVLAFSLTSFAQCGASFTSMASAVAAIQSQSRAQQASGQNTSVGTNSATDDNDGNQSIVGLWHIRFMAGDQLIQEAFQIWNEGGTEAHNPNVDPRGGSICLGAWKTAPQHKFKLTHRVWNYGTDGTFNGTINLSETLTLSNHGNAHTGSFTLDFYDPAGNFLFSVPGNVIGERIAVN